MPCGWNVILWRVLVAALGVAMMLQASARESEQPEVPSLRAIYALALQYDNTWAAAQQRHLASREAYPIALSAMLPSVNVSGSYARLDRESVQTTSSNERQYTSDAIRLQIRQPILSLERVFRMRMAESEVTISEFELELSRQDLIRRTVSAYFALLTSQEQVALSGWQIKAISAQREQAERLRRAGIATLTDVYEAQARLDRARAEEIQAISALEVSRRALIKIVGRPLDQVAGLRDAAHFSIPEPNNLDAWVNEAVQKAIVVLGRQHAVERATHDLSRARSQHLPTVDAFVSYERSSNTDTGLASDKIGRVGVELNIPLYAGGRLSAQTREAAARRYQADEELQLARREAELEASTAFSELSSSLARIKALEAAVKSGEVALAAAEKSFEVAYRTFVDVLNAQQLLYSSRFELLRARFDYIQAMVRLNAAVGALDDAVVERIDLWLDNNN